MTSKKEGLVASRVKGLEGVNKNLKMTSKNEGLVAERVKMLQCVNESKLEKNNVTFSTNKNVYNKNTAKENTHRLTQPSRAAPPAPHQRPRAAPAAPHQRPRASATVDSAVTLLSTHNNLENATVVRVLPTKSNCVLSIKDDGKAIKKVSDEDYAGGGSSWKFPPDVRTAWDTIRSRFSAVEMRFETTTPTIKTKLSLILLFSILCFGVYSVFNGKENTPNVGDIDRYFQSFNYSAEKLLTYRGETVKFNDKKSEFHKTTCVIIERKKQCTSNVKSDIGILSSNEHLTFPGSILLANQRLMDNTPDVMAIDRSPLTYTVNLPGLTSKGSFTIVPSFSKYQNAVNDVLNTWFEEYSNSRSIPANFQSSESFAYSKQLLRVKFGLDFSLLGIEAGIKFDAMEKGETLIKIFKYTQVFYTVSVELAKNPSDLFDSSITLEEIKRKTDDQNPPVLVDSVSYGRNVYIKIETRSVEKGTGLNLDFLDLKNGLEKIKDLKDLNIQVYIIGGHTSQTHLYNANNANEIYDVITNFSSFSKNNLGYPILYSSRYINTNQKAVVHLSTDFVETVGHDICHREIAIIKLIQKTCCGKWTVTWTEISLDDGGNEILQKRQWNKKSFLPFVSEDIELLGYVKELRVVAEYFVIFEGWRTVINRSDIPTISRREFIISDDMTGDIQPPIVY